MNNLNGCDNKSEESKHHSITIENTKLPNLTMKEADQMHTLEKLIIENDEPFTF